MASRWSQMAEVFQDHGPTLPEYQMAEVREAFRLFDLDHSGDIDLRELGTVLRALGANPSQDELAAMMAQVDDDNSGRIEFEEFCKLLATKIQVTDTQAELQEAFHVFDENDTGEISTASLRTIVSGLAEHLNPEEVDEIIELVDTGRTGRVSLEQFEDLMTLAGRRPILPAVESGGASRASGVRFER